jgi:hypothetical protein
MAACSICGKIGTFEEIENHKCFDREETANRWKTESKRLKAKARKLKICAPFNAARIEGMAEAYKKCAKELLG